MSLVIVPACAQAPDRAEPTKMRIRTQAIDSLARWQNIPGSLLATLDGMSYHASGPATTNTCVWGLLAPVISDALESVQLALASVVATKANLDRSGDESGKRICPLWVISGHTDKSAPCPLYPR
jgi:hypothetical protein